MLRNSYGLMTINVMVCINCSKCITIYCIILRITFFVSCCITVVHYRSLLKHLLYFLMFSSSLGTHNLTNLLNMNCLLKFCRRVRVTVTVSACVNERKCRHIAYTCVYIILKTFTLAYYNIYCIY